MFFFCAEQKYCICQLLSAAQYIVFLQLDDRIFCFLCQAKDKMDENRGCKHGKRGKTKEWLSPYVFMEEFCYIIIGKESLDGPAYVIDRNGTLFLSAKSRYFLFHCGDGGQ